MGAGRRTGSERVDEQPRTQFRFEPSAFRGHDLAGVSDIHQLAHGHGVQGEGDGGVTGVDLLAEVIGAADTADEADAFAGARVVDAEDGGEDVVL